MSSNKNYIPFLIAVFLFISCGENGKKEIQPEIDLNDIVFITKQAKNIFGKNVQNVIAGNYTDTTKQFAVLTETITPDVWGINFNLMVLSSKGFEAVFYSELLPGSFKESEVKNIRMPGTSYDLIYYNSLDYFMGSGGGEIFSYIVDYKLEKTYYAHLVVEAEKPVSLYISENTSVQEIKDFFIKTFKNDYPSLTIISVDIELE